MPLYYVGRWLLLTKCACVFIVYTMSYLQKEVNTEFNSRPIPIQVSNHITVDTTVVTVQLPIPFDATFDPKNMHNRPCMENNR